MRQAVLVIVATLWTGWVNGSTDEISMLDYIDSLPDPELMTGVGNSRLDITTDSKEAQQYFNQGVSLLHDFWWFEAYRSFLHASKLDPDSPMTHWGIYRAASSMANLTKEEATQVLEDAIAAMEEYRANASEREQYYLDAMIARHAGRGENSDREAATKAHNAKLVALLEKYPDEIEARLFLWRSLDGGYHADGSPRSEQLYGQLLLEREFEAHGDHPGLLHYWIHSQEPGPDPGSALDAAQRLADLAPSSGHIVHMPGHIHYLIGNYADAHLQFKKAEDADFRYMAAYDMEPIFTWNYLHNFSFMMSNLAEAGRLAEGATYAGKLGEMTEASSFRHFPHFEMLLGRAILEQAFMTIRVEQFAEAAELLSDDRWDAWEKSDGLKAIQAAYHAYAAGMAAAEAGKPGVAASYSRELDSILWRVTRDDVSLIYRKKPLEIAAMELQGMVALSRGDNEEAISLLQRAVELELDIGYSEPRPNIHPAGESLARAYMADENWDAARDAYEAVLVKRPNAGMVLFGIARSHELEGNTGNARTAYEAFQAAWRDADERLPQVRHARSWLAGQ